MDPKNVAAIGLRTTTRTADPDDKAIMMEIFTFTDGGYVFVTETPHRWAPMRL